MIFSRKWLRILGVLWLTHCSASGARAPILSQWEAALESPQVRELQRTAPEAWTEVVRASQAVQAAGRSEEAVWRAEEAALVLEWATSEAGVGRARARLQRAETATQEAEAQRLQLEQRAAEITASIAQQEAQRAARNTTASDTNPAVRNAVARELRQQAQLALASAALLGMPEAERAATERQLAEVEESARTAAPNVVLANSGRVLRAAEEVLRRARVGRFTGGADVDATALVQTLSEAGGLEPRRDERGVLVALQGLFDARGQLVPSARGRLAVVARVLQQQAQGPVRVEAFVGGDARTAEARGLAQARRVVEELTRTGVPATRLNAAGLPRIEGGMRSRDVIEVLLVLGREQ